MMGGDIPTLDFTVPVDQQRLMYNTNQHSPDVPHAYANEDSGYANELYETPPPQLGYDKSEGLETVPGIFTVHDRSMSYCK